MAYKRKFTPGEPFTDVHEAVAAILAGEWTYHNHKVTHPGWARGWSVALIQTAVQQGMLFRAIPTETPCQTFDG